MPKKNQKKDRKRSCGQHTHKVRYQEKLVTQWQCAVCHQKYDRSQNYCLTCMQSLYYYCYINNQLFVTNDDSYLDLYYNRPADDLSSCSQTSENESYEQKSEEEVKFGWVEDLLV